MFLPITRFSFAVRLTTSKWQVLKHFYNSDMLTHMFVFERSCNIVIILMISWVFPDFRWILGCRFCAMTAGRLRIVHCSVYNLGTGNGTSVLEMVSASEKASRKAGERLGVRIPRYRAVLELSGRTQMYSGAQNNSLLANCNGAGLSTCDDMDRTFTDAIYALRRIHKNPTAEIRWIFSSARIITKAMRM
ncbi:hypothetical protein YC2023_095984 [Brassica napus]